MHQLTLPPRRPARGTLAAMLAAAAISGALAVPALAHPYPPTFVRTFLKACTKTADALGSASKGEARRYCSLDIRCIERHLTLRQVIAVEADMAEGRANPNALVIAACAKAAVAKILRGQGERRHTLASLGIRR